MRLWAWGGPSVDGVRCGRGRARGAGRPGRRGGGRWRCASVPLGEDEVYGAAMHSKGTGSQKYDEVFELTDLEQDAGGHDLAIARISCTVEPSWHWRVTRLPGERT